MTNAINYYFAYNAYEGTQVTRWECVPQDIWQKLILSFSTILRIDSVGFQNIDSLEMINKYPFFRNFDLKTHSISCYNPYHKKSKINIITFHFNEVLQQLLISEDFDQWNCANESLPFDEIVFFSERNAKVIAIPYENIIFFKNINEKEYFDLSNIDIRIAGNMHKSTW